MFEKYEASFERLKNLSNDELDRLAHRIVRVEKRNVAETIAHLFEISKRRLHIELGFSSLFEYCVKRLGLSEGSTWRRIQVAKICQKFPLVLEYLAENRLTLTVAALLCPHLENRNVKELLTDCENKTKRQVEAYLVALKPKPEFEPTIRRQPARCARAKATHPLGDSPSPGVETTTRRTSGCSVGNTIC